MPLWVPAAMGAAMGYRMASGPYKTKALRGTRARMRVRSRANFRMASMKRRRTKNWKAKARRMVGLPRNFSTSKTAETIFPLNVPVPQKLVWSSSLINLVKGFALNQRLRDSVVVSGVKLHVFAKHRGNIAGNVICNWAVVVTRGNKSFTGEQAFSNIQNFFRDYDADRAWNTDDTAKTGLSWAEAKINLDDFIVVHRGKFTLGALDSNRSQTLESEKMISRWVKLGRSMTFDDAITVPDEQVRFVFWCADRSTGAGGPVVGTPDVDLRVRAITYFREPKSG